MSSGSWRRSRRLLGGADDEGNTRWWQEASATLAWRCNVEDYDSTVEWWKKGL